MKSQIIYLKKLELFKELDNFREGQFYAIADQRVKNHLPQWIQFSPYVFWLKNPEEEKNLETYSNVIDFFLRQGIHRKSVLYAFGGGATMDLAGFIAATIIKGVNWVSVPTTLVGMVESAAGGQVGLNTVQGKNLIGSSHSPFRIYLCGDFLTTLNEKDLVSGKGEILKYALLSKEIYDLVIKKVPVDEVALECARLKLRVTQYQSHEESEGVFLNLGQIFGNAFEVMLNLPHGTALAMGLKYFFLVMKHEEAFIHWQKLVKALQMPMEKLDLDEFRGFDTNVFLSCLVEDKKKGKTNLKVVMLRSVGSCYIEEMNLKDLNARVLGHPQFKALIDRSIA